MRRLLVDTSAWIALYDPDDQYHAAAKRVWKEFASQPVGLLTSDYVLDETYTHLRRRVGLKAAVTLHNVLAHSKVVRILDVDASRTQTAPALPLCRSTACMKRSLLMTIFLKWGL